MWFSALILALQTMSDPATPDPAEIERLEQEENEAGERAAAARREAEALAAEIVDLQTRLVSAANRVSASEQNALEIERRIADLTSEEAVILDRLLSGREALIDVLAALQRIERGTPPALAAAPGDAEEAARAASLLASITPDLQARAETLAAELENLRTVREAVEVQRLDLASTEAELDTRQATIRQLLVERRELEA
ncbi:MAG: hypothetical protein COW29_10540, partial [Rhodobacterales bacterium CG15_BIG_FIL_POST_REV_8_21_14_020_59_13]